MSNQDIDLLQENLLQGGNATNRLDMKVPNKEMTWTKFHNTFSGKGESHEQCKSFRGGYKNQVIEWEGTVLRVDGFDEQIEYVKHTKGDQKDEKEFDAINEYSEDEIALT